MIKLICLFKRRPGMSVQEFEDYYENHHSKLGEKYMPLARRYVRRYVKPQTNPITGIAEELDFDVVMEIWWDNQADYKTTMAAIASDEIRPIFEEDEKKIFDGHHNRIFLVEERESVMAKG